MSTAGVIVIGNEVLSGKVREENATFFVRELRRLGVKLSRMVFLRDEVEEIAAEVRAMSSAYDHVFTSGGIGSTHDDVTMEAMARAFGVALVEHPRLIERMRCWYPDGISDAARRMALLPAGTNLVDTGDHGFPLVKVENVWVFPGVPSFLRMKFAAIAPGLACPPFVLRAFRLDVEESRIADALSTVARAFPDVEIGSYPRFDRQDYRVKVTIEARDAVRVRLCARALRDVLDPAWIVRDACEEEADSLDAGE